MLPLAVSIAALFTLDLFVLRAAAAVASTGGAARVQKPPANSVKEPYYVALEEERSLRRLDAFNYRGLQEATGDAADGESQDGLESRRLAGLEVKMEAELGGQEPVVKEEDHKDSEDVVELEHRRALRTMKKLPSVKGGKTLFASVVLLIFGSMVVHKAFMIAERGEDPLDIKIAEVLARVGLGVWLLAVGLSIISIARLVPSVARRRKWVEEAQKAILGYQAELERAEGKGAGEEQTLPSAEVQDE
ncbi:hypothetical protein Esti_003033 [Eimeria stiedai]